MPRYIPCEYLESANTLSETGVKEVNNLNMELVHRLKSTDMAFSMGRLTLLLLVVGFMRFS